jgi:hypothetical protein
MGANAQTAVPVFTAGQVLTAQQQTEINTGVPVFATTVTRDAAFGGAGEKALAEGQFAYIEATNATQYYDGAAWQSVGASSGFTFITGTSFSAVTSVSLPASTFTSTYRNYKIFYDISTMSADATLTLRLRASGTDNSTNNYFSSGFINCTTNTTNVTAPTNSITIFANDSYGNVVNFTRSWSYIVYQNDIIYNQNTLAGNVENIKINVTIDSMFNSISANLVYK